MIAYIITTVVAIEAIGIMVIEMFGSSAMQAKSFELDKSFVEMPEVKTLLANQGIYNGLLGVLIISTMLMLTGPQQILMLQMEMLFILIAAVYGSLTAARKIIFVQGLPALIALITLFMTN
ncbi:DUF1304 domain-containing protein [Leuconostoc carnosum]|uniref:DUF1304 domain-containing protein n=1 Tax=Leuconostoc carnosum TaxID=1252 RepID=UPI0012392DBF|nr:DUF1304 domain-containing protein [Leuconostoc carnosum]KAA8370897.1 DUF1304 domain-containing protein [Leuconostoc carnosum]KAA8382540.1 DUF1304 domain-containing protein [Leuconostoc carnosum]